MPIGNINPPGGGKEHFPSGLSPDMRNSLLGLNHYKEKMRRSAADYEQARRQNASPEELYSLRQRYTTEIHRFDGEIEALLPKSLGSHPSIGQLVQRRDTSPSRAERGLRQREIRETTALIIDRLVKEQEERSLISGIGFAEEANPTHKAAMEDVHVQKERFGEDPRQAFFAIYDGHNSRIFAEGAAAILDEKFRKKVQDEKLSPQEAFPQAYQETNQELYKQHGMQKGGSTAVTVYIHDNIMYIANAGDSRAVLVRENQPPFQLSHDHKVGNLNDTEEQERIRLAGGKIISGFLIKQNKLSVQEEALYRQMGKNPPVLVTKLAVSRSFGDYDIPGVTVEPFVLDPPVPLRPDDKWIIVACDGVWDMIKNAELPGIIGSETDPNIVASKIKDEALIRGSKDNISVFAIQLSINQIDKPSI